MAEISPRKVQEQVSLGFKRFENFRKARLMFLRNYVGPYYDSTHGDVGAEALNLIFNAVRSVVPHIVMQNPKCKVWSRYLEHRNYAELLSLALDFDSKTKDLRTVYRRGIVDAIFTLGILKTGLAESDSVYVFDDNSKIDTGTVYTECVDFDNFVVDPESKQHMFRDARWMGDRICVPRSALLDSGLYKNDLIERLPTAGTSNDDNEASDLSMQKIQSDNTYDFEDEVEIVELWVPGSNVIITVPGADDFTCEKFLRVDDYYGPSEGPYSLLALTPPVPGNPMPIPAVGVWNDLHTLANRMAKKIVDQADRQKDITAYRPSSADDAEALRDAADGESVAVDDPDGVKVLSYGGQQQSNDIHLAQLQGWFNQMSGNVDQLAGMGSSADSATEASILASNANIGLEDMKDGVYQWVGAEARKRLWYFHTDELINTPLIRRETQPAQFDTNEYGVPVMVKPATAEDVQVFLTPEERRGDWIDYHLEIQAESMGRVDSRIRLKQAIDFATQILPSVVQTAQQMQILGLPFNAKAFLIRMATDAGITWMDEVFDDPEFQQKLMMQMAAGPAPTGKAAGGEGSGGFSPQGMAQNGQLPTLGAGGTDPMTDMLQQAQAGANDGQAALRGPGGMI